MSASGNAFMTDIATWFVEAAAADRSGRDARHRPACRATPASPTSSLAPHEFFLLHDAATPSSTRRRRSACRSATEQPGTQWFFLGPQLLPARPLVLDINANGVDGAAALRRRGETAPARRGAEHGERAPSSGTSTCCSSAATPRGAEPCCRRSVRCCGTGAADLRLFRFTEPVHGGVPGLVFGQDKYDLLARARMLVNIHRDDTVARILRVGQDDRGDGQRCRGRDRAVDRVRAARARRALRRRPTTSPVRCRSCSTTRTVALRSARRRGGRCSTTYPLAGSLGPILDRLDAIDLGARSALRQSADPARTAITRVHGRPLMPVFRPAPSAASRVFHALLAEQDIQRSIESVRCQIRYGDPNHDLEFATPGYRVASPTGATPDVSVVVTLYNYAGVVVETLDSLVASSGGDDRDRRGRRPLHGRRPRGRAGRSWTEHPDLPILLLGRENNCGLPKARNHGIERARSDKVMIIDADNSVYPMCLRRLADALDAEPGRQLRLRHPRGVRRRARPAEPPALVRAVAVRGQLPRRPGDDPRATCSTATAATAKATSGSTAGRTGTSGCGSPRPASTACTSTRCSAAIAPSEPR